MCCYLLWLTKPPSTCSCLFPQSKKIVTAVAREGWLWGLIDTRPGTSGGPSVELGDTWLHTHSGSSDWLPPAASGPFLSSRNFSSSLCNTFLASRSTTITAKTYWALYGDMAGTVLICNISFLSQLPWEVGSIIISVSYKWESGDIGV